MRFIGAVIEKLQRHPKRIVFPEGAEPRVLQAARQFHSLRLGVPILLGDRTKISEVAKALNVPLQGIRVINPAESEDLDNFTRRFKALHRAKGMKTPEARDAMLNPNFFGAMMVALRQADGFVSGTNAVTSGVLRPLLQIIRPTPHANTTASCIILELENARIGEDGVLFMADCDVVIEPTTKQVADIALSTARLARHLMGTCPRVALLSFSTKGSATHPSAGKMQAAAALAAQMAKATGLEADFDGELQADTAIVPEIAARKAPESKVAGRANVLIFPDLNAANIASKLVHGISRANAYGHLLLGLGRPAADVSRGSEAHEVLGVAAIIGVEAIAYDQLYPGSGQLAASAQKRPSKFPVA